MLACQIIYDFSLALSTTSRSKDSHTCRMEIFCVSRRDAKRGESCAYIARVDVNCCCSFVSIMIFSFTTLKSRSAPHYGGLPGTYSSMIIYATNTVWHTDDD